MAAIEEFLAWWSFSYPSHNAGALSVVHLAMHGAIVAQLLTHRPASQLKHLAIAMWLLKGKPYWRGGHVGGTLVEPDDGERWIVRSDRSLQVLRHKADYLDRRLNDFPAWWFDCPHTPRCGAADGCQARLAPEVRQDAP